MDKDISISRRWVVLTLGIIVTTVTTESSQTVSVHTTYTVLTVSPQYLDSHTAHRLSGNRLTVEGQCECHLKYIEIYCIGSFLSIQLTKMGRLTAVDSKACHKAKIVS